MPPLSPPLAARIAHVSLPRMQDKLFPFHVAFDDELVVEQVGSKLWAMCPHLELNQPLSAHFSLVSPKWDRYVVPDNICPHCLCSVGKSEMVVTRHPRSVTATRVRDSDDLLFTFQTTIPSGPQITLTGQVRPGRDCSVCGLHMFHTLLPLVDYLSERLKAVCLPCDAYFEVFTGSKLHHIRPPGLQPRLRSTV